MSLLNLLLFTPITATAIVNMDGLHFVNKKDTTTADLDLSISGASGNSERSKAALNGQFGWLTKNSIHLAIMGYQYGENNTVRNVNKAFIHYRYIHRLTQQMDIELFTQLEKNEFTRLSYRGLIGTGLRFALANLDRNKMFLGAGAFHSKEKVEFVRGLTDDGVEEFARGNFYLLSKYKISPTMSASNVLYYQPRLSRFDDYRALFETKLDFKINESLYFRLSLDIEHDSEPSQTIEKTDVSYKSGLKYSF